MGHGADWIKKAYRTEPSELGAKVADLLDVLYGGIYHIDHPGLKKVDWTNKYFIHLKLPQHCRDMANVDFDHLTWLVVLTHDRCLRVSIQPGTFTQLQLTFHPRERHEPGMSISKGIPTIEEAVAKARAKTEAHPLLKGITKQETGYKFGTHKLRTIEEIAKIEHNGRTYKILRVETHDGLEYVSMRLYNATGKFIKQLLIEPCLTREFSTALGLLNG